MTLQEFAALGRAFRGLKSTPVSADPPEPEFAEPADTYEVFDEDILADVKASLEPKTGKLERLFNVTVDDEGNFRGNATQRIALGRTQTYEFETGEGGDRLRYKLVDADKVTAFAESDLGFYEVIEFAKMAGKQLKCKPGNVQCGGKCQAGTKNCFDGMDPAQKKSLQSAATKAKRMEKNKVGDLTKADMEAALTKKFGVDSISELAKDNQFAMANGGKGKGLAPNGNEIRQTSVLAQQYRKHIGIIPNDPANQPGVRGVINGINVFHYWKPWQVLGLDPKKATGNDLKDAYKKLAKQYHPDNQSTGDREVFEKLDTIYKSLGAAY